MTEWTDALTRILAAWACFVAIGAMFALPWGCLYWVLGPIDRAAKNRQYPPQFSLADLLSLFVLVQLPVGIVHWAVQGSESLATERESLAAEAVVDVLVAGTAIVVWWKCVGTLSRAGIGVVWHRCMILAVGLPVVLAAIGALMILPCAAFVVLTEQNDPIGWWMLVAEAPVAGVLFGLSRFTRAIVAQAETRHNESATASDR
jgi:hypothetical protein